jgi:hypothetical protein
MSTCSFMRGNKPVVDKGNPRRLRVLVICYEYLPLAEAADASRLWSRSVGRPRT